MMVSSDLVYDTNCSPDFRLHAASGRSRGAYPHLYHQTRRALEVQTQRIAERCALFVPRPAAVTALEQAVRDCAGGVVALDCDHGGGATALICWLVATRRWAFWLPEDDAGSGLAALCAQILALADLPVPLVPPVAARDALTLERLLAEAAETRQPGEPLVVVIGRMPDDTDAPVPPPLPASLPQGVVVVMVTTPDAQPPAVGVHFAARVPLPADDDGWRRLPLVSAEIVVWRRFWRHIARDRRSTCVWQSGCWQGGCSM